MNDDLLKDFLELPNEKTLAWLEQNKKQLNIEFVAALRAEAQRQAYQKNLEEAQHVLDRAAQVPHVIETPIAMGLVWRGRAHVLQLHGHYEDSLNATQQAVGIYEQYNTEDKAFDIACTRTLDVYTLGVVGRFEEAIELAYQIRTHFIRRHFEWGLACLAGNLAQVYTLAWQPQLALQEYEQAYDIFLKMNYKLKARHVLHDMGVAANRLDQLDMARTYHMRALPALREAGDVLRVIKTYYNLAELSLREGKYDQALVHLDQARQDDLANVESKGYIDRFEADVRRILGQNDEARHLLEQALAAFEEMEYDIEVGRTLVALGQLLAKEPTSTSEALTYFERAEQSFQTLTKSPPAFAAFSKLEQGQLWLKIGRIAEAVACAEAAYPVFDEMNSPLRCAEAQILLGDCCSEKQPERAKQFYQSALQAVGSQTPTLAYRCWHGLARLAAAEGRYSDAEQAYEQAVTLLDTVRRALSQHRQQAGFLEDKQALVEELVTVLHQQPDSEPRILTWVERFKAGVLAELLMGMSVKKDPDDEFQALLAEREQVRAKLDHWESQLRGEIGLSETFAQQRGSAVGQQRGSAVKSQEQYNTKRRTALHRELQALDEKLARLNRAAYEWHEGAAIEPEAVHELLDEETILLSYYTAEGGQLYALTATHTAGDLQIHALGTPLEEIATRWNRLAPLMMRPKRRLKSLQKRLADLWKRLIAPMAERLRTKKRLLILPYRELFDIPWAGLYDAQNKRYLIEEWTIQIAPSATVLAKVGGTTEVVTTGRGGGTTEVVTTGKGGGTTEVVTTGRREGLPLLVGYPGEPYLQAVEPEIEGLKKLLPEAEVLFGEAVTVHNIMKRLPKRPLIHIAGHIVYDHAAPLESGIPLAEKRWLRASDLYLRYGYLDRSTVVLSGCESASGSAKGGDILGLTSAFLYAGATGIVASLWPVDDAATAHLMSAFYQKITASHATADALRHAQIELLHHQATAHPYYWAPFLLNGASRIL